MKNHNPKKPLQLLLVEDSPSDAALLQEHILSSGARGFSVNVVTSLQKAVDHLKNNRPHAVLLDLNLPDSAGLSTVRQVRQASPHVPLIVLTGFDDEKTGMEAVQAGVQDFLVKGQADGRMITRAVQYAIERKNTEEALRESEERFKAIAETTPVGIGVIDVSESTFLYVNNAYAKLFGCTESEILGKAAPEIYWNAEDRNRIQEKLKKDGFIAEYEVRFRRKDGTPFWVLSSLRPITYGDRPALLSAFVDITGRKNAEELILRNAEELRRNNEELERFNLAMVDREIRVIELKKQVNELCGRLGEPPRFSLAFEEKEATFPTRETAS